MRAIRGDGEEHRRNTIQNDDSERSPDSHRESIWSVPPEYRAFYFTLFIILSITGITYLSWYEITQNIRDSVHATIVSIMIGSAAIFVTSAGTGVVASEVKMVIAQYLEEKVYRPRREKRRAETQKQIEEEVAAEVEAEVERVVATLREQIEAEVRKQLEEEKRQAVKQAREEAREEAHEEARETFSAQVRRWNQRRLDAEAKGEPFDEPPPISD